jgi:hypothetical protein
MTTRQRRTALTVGAGGVVVVAAIWLVAASNSALQTSLGVVAAVASAAAAIWVAWRSGDSSASHDARMAMALHMKAWPHVHLFRTPGRDGDPWMWIVTLGQGLEAAKLRLQWNVDGRQCDVAYERLGPDQIWTHPSYIDGQLGASDIRSHVGSISIEWEDPAHCQRWRSLVEIAPGASRGTPAPNGDGSGFLEQDVPFVNNRQPIAAR